VISEPRANDGVDTGGPSLVIVRVQDAVDSRLTGRSGGLYESPPQTPEQAMALVRLLAGGESHEGNGESRWVTAIAGGRRTVTVEPAPIAAGSPSPSGGR
jgi:hypothetical protein